MKEISPPPLSPSIIPKIPLFLLALFLSTSLTHSLTTDGVILLAFKLSIINDPQSVLNSWNPSDTVPCSWHGVSCSVSTDQEPHVISLSLPNSNLLGSLPANIGLLSRLQSLNLANNSINGSLTDTLFSLSDLRVLNLSNNLISGGFSDVVGGLRSLESLDLSENALDGIIPRNLAGLQNLSSVSLRGNYFSGNIPGGFDRVRVLDLSSNLINGSLPVDFGGENIQYFNISYNKLSGQISPEFYQNIPENATIDFSYNNLTGEIPGSGLLHKQDPDSYTGNPNLCGPPLENSCSPESSPSPSPSPSPTGLPQLLPPPAIAAKPRTWSSSPATAVSPKDEPEVEKSKNNNNNLRPHIIAAIVVGDLVGVAIISMVFLHVYRSKKNASSSSSSNTGPKNVTINPSSSLSSFSSSSSESKGLAKWSCLRKGKNNEDQIDNDDEEEVDEEEETVEVENKEEEQGKMVTVDGETELDVETLLKASAYILGVSGSSIMYKAVLENGTVLAVRRVGDCISNGGEKFKEFESNVRAIAKLIHPNLVRVRAFYWALHEKLLIYEYLPYGSLANARPRKAGSSPCHMSWEVRLRIARGVARGLAYIHDKKQVHGNLKPSNILLDHDMEPKISDFGLDRLTTGKPGYIPGASTRHFGSKRSTTSRDSLQDYSIGATPSPSASSIGCVSPYHPPESLRSLKPNPKWDVYSFGVILLELLTGKVVVSDELGPPVLAGLAVGLEDKTRILRMADGSIRVELEGKEESLINCLKLGYNCISHVPQKRPTMKEALQMLEKVTSSNSSISSTYYGP